MDAVAVIAAVPFGNDALPRAILAGRHDSALHARIWCDAGDRTEGTRQIDMANRLFYHRRGDPGSRCGTPDHRQPHQRIDMVRPLEHHAEIALEFAVVGSIEDVRLLP